MKGRQFSLRNFFSNSTSEINRLNNINNAITTSAPINAPFTTSQSDDNLVLVSSNHYNANNSNANNSNDSKKMSPTAPLSILKKRIASSGEAVELTLGSCTNLSWTSPVTSPENSPPTSAPVSPSQKRKSAQFKDNVDVMYFRKDDTADNTSKGMREQEKLKEVSTRKSRHTSVNHLVKCPLHDKHCNEDLVHHFTDVQGNIISNEPLFPGKQFEIISENDCLRWKISVPVGTGFVRNRTNVKAMTGGKKLIISGFKTAKTPNGEEYLHQYNDKLSLPHPIDAFAVKATMSREGVLKISAPLITSDTASPSSPSLSKATVI